MMTENTRILCIQAKNESDTQFVEAFQRVFIFRIGILLIKCIVQQTDDFASRNGDFHFSFQVFISCFYKELQTIVVPFQIGQLDFLRFTAGTLHIIDIELRKVTSHHPTRMLRQWQLCNIAFCLLERSQHRAVRLFDGFV